MKNLDEVDIGLSCSERYDTNSVKEFLDSLRFNNLKIAYDVREEEAPFASFDWVMSTAIILFI